MPDGVHPDADGHGRQLRLAGVRHGHPRHQPGRDRIFATFSSVVWKEIRVAVLCGICLAIACFGKIMLVDHMLLKSESVTTWVALVVSLSMAADGVSCQARRLVRCRCWQRSSASTRRSWRLRSSRQLWTFCPFSSILPLQPQFFISAESIKRAARFFRAALLPM